ncbi:MULTISPECIES: RNA-binding S4 domain-containing protein [Corynebacterium]|uniref:RNA-binding S4 domain-containing protein n=2 Tax=Corynebacterium TaxID=1716 RepID=A0A934I084_9CORY|nr:MULTISPECIES: RNA-binding S4 domain-containing protein [Corynebacterium]MBI8989817.1 RNA-binding S4 domain-containing protein [Corynebacterium meridianum]MCK7642592.1 RNA-binding S4 domain-containing protein [Corynebacterium antarcticum]MCK7660723.1 RNA-binding S4 domain-containing protein [Corynebacterium antarcticum]MCK7677771.1 RNA-binding S4 domain-containing protein [Corynebacterium meridianum]MCL0245469.1 RNA-binding S4 domain-containing protein [Corynebacterium antarcticum]
MEAVDVAIRDDTIKLGQFIKLANLVDTGGAAKEAIAAGEVTVNGEADTRRGRTLRVGDVVTVGGASARVAASGSDDDDDFFDEATANDDFDPEKWRNM